MKKAFESIKKIIICTIVFMVSMVALSKVSYGQANDIHVYVDHEKIEFEINPILKENRVLVPMRKIFEKLDAQVTWDNETRSVYANKDDIKIKLTIDSNLININGEEIRMDSPPLLHKGTTLVPLRIISESYGFQVKWIPDSREVRIITKPAYVRNGQLKLDIGMSLDELESIMGSPSRIDPGGSNTSWYTYNNSPTSYEDYILLRLEDERLSGIQTNSKNWSLSNLIQVKDKFSPRQFKNKFEEKHVASYYDLDVYVHNSNNIINGFSIMEAGLDNFYEEEYSFERLRGIEQQIFDMTNVYRINNDLNILVWNDRLSDFARNHSRDMIENNYFSHDSLNESYQDRIQALLIEEDWDRCGENLGYGRFDSMILMDGWYNSETHNRNLVNKEWKYHGVGVLKNESNKLYGTQNFTK